MKKLTGIALIFILFLSVQACKDRKGKNFNKTAKDTTTVAIADTSDFIYKGAEAGNAEVQLSQLALKNSKNDKIKAYANMIILDHTDAGNEFTILADDQKIKMPDSLNSAHGQLKTSLAKKTGFEFDKEYIQAMVTDHEKAIALFKTGAADKNAKISDFAAKMLPKLQAHLKEANTICAELK